MKLTPDEQRVIDLKALDRASLGGDIRMKLNEVPSSPAYVVFHDAFDHGAMDVYPAESIELAKSIASRKQDFLDNNGYDESGTWKAYEKLPRVRIHKFHPERIQP